MSTTVDIAADMTDWFDAHVAFSGYRNDPLEGSAFTPFTAIYEQLDRHGLAGARQLGVATEFAAFDANFSHAERRLRISRSGPYIEPLPQGFRFTRSVTTSAQMERAIEMHRSEGFDWLALGSGLDRNLLASALEICADGPLRVAVEGSPDRLDLADRIDSVENLLAALVPLGPGAEPAETWRLVAGLASTPVECHLEALAPLLEAGTVLVPLVVAARRLCLLSEVVTAPGLADLTAILPFHARIAELRNPGAYRFGRKHAEKYLGLPRLGRAETAELESGWRRLCEVLAAFVEQGGRVAGGSGAPSTGLAPGFALAEEARAWVQAGIAPSDVMRAFTDTGRSLVGVATCSRQDLLDMTSPSGDRSRENGD